MKRFDIRVDPRQLRIGNLFDDKANELIAEVLADVSREILDPWGNLRALNNPGEGECRDWGLLKLFRLRVGDRVGGGDRRPGARANGDRECKL